MREKPEEQNPLREKSPQEKNPKLIQLAGYLHTYKKCSIIYFKRPSTAISDRKLSEHNHKIKLFFVSRLSHSKWVMILYFLHSK